VDLFFVTTRVTFCSKLVRVPHPETADSRQLIDETCSMYVDIRLHYVVFDIHLTFYILRSFCSSCMWTIFEFCVVARDFKNRVKYLFQTYRAPRGAEIAVVRQLQCPWNLSKFTFRYRNVTLQSSCPKVMQITWICCYECFCTSFCFQTACICYVTFQFLLLIQQNLRFINTDKCIKKLSVCNGNMTHITLLQQQKSKRCYYFGSTSP